MNLRETIDHHAFVAAPLTDDEIEKLARPHTMRELLDWYAEAERNGEAEVARKLRWLVDGRHAEIEAWSFGSSIVCASINGRRPE